MSPNPNAIAAADTFHLPLTSVMVAGIIPGIFGLALTYFLAKRLKTKALLYPNKRALPLILNIYPHF